MYLDALCMQDSTTVCLSTCMYMPIETEIKITIKSCLLQSKHLVRSEGGGGDGILWTIQRSLMGLGGVVFLITQIISVLMPDRLTTRDFLGEK